MELLAILTCELHFFHAGDFRSCQMPMWTGVQRKTCWRSHGYKLTRVERP